VVTAHLLPSSSSTIHTEKERYRSPSVSRASDTERAPEFLGSKPSGPLRLRLSLPQQPFFGVTMHGFDWLLVGGLRLGCGDLLGVTFLLREARELGLQGLTE
jgi:hypothetical protein